MPKNQVARFQMMAANKQATSASSVNRCESTISLPTVFATVTPKRNGPRNSATAVIPRAVCGWNAREEIMVATILLESRIPFKNSKINARIITRINSEDIVTLSGSLYNDIRDRVRGFISAICCIGQMPIDLAHLQHFNNVMNILRPAEQICDGFAIHGFHAVLQGL